MVEHLTAFALGFILDLIFGDPHWMPHPIRWMGFGIGYLEKRWNNNGKSEWIQRRMGSLMVLTVLLTTLVVSTVVLAGAYLLNPYLGIAFEAVMTYQILATKCLRDESMKVYSALMDEDLREARNAVAMIVGRDTQQLDYEGVAKAAVETVAENTSDGVIAPMLYTLLGGPVLGLSYKAVNTMDSMVGYKNERYQHFGRTAARLDDVVNYIPARICAGWMIIASYLLSVFYRERTIEKRKSSTKIFDGRRAYRIYRRDRYQHGSPNSGHTEAVCAGALGIQLAGDASYFGKILKKPFIGDKEREVETEDIKRANVLLYTTAWLCEVAGLIILLVMELIWRYC